MVYYIVDIQEVGYTEKRRLTMEPLEIVICKKDVGIRARRLVSEDDWGNEYLDSAINIEETSQGETIKSIYVGRTEALELAKALRKLARD